MRADAARARRDDPDLVRDDAWRTANAGRLMFAATDAFVRDKLAAMRAGGVAGGSEAAMALWLNLDRDGTRLTELARRAGQTKQSMIELVDRAESMLLVERRPDPDDLRAKMVFFTPAGTGVLAALEAAIRAAERRFMAVVGMPFVDALKRELGGYAGVPMTDDVAASTDASWRRRNPGRLLSLAARRFAGDLLDAVHERGHRDVTEVLLTLVRHLDLEGTRLTVLAARARMTKQSMRELVDQAETLRLIVRRPDPHDRRAKIVRFTAAGLDLLAEVERGVMRAEARLETLTGAAFVGALKARLTDYLRAVDAGGHLDQAPSARAPSQATAQR